MPSDRPRIVPPEIADYIRGHCSPPDDATLQKIRRDTAALGAVGAMQIGTQVGALLSMLVAISNSKVAVEVGAFTGYSAACIARALPAEADS